jgi:protein arginine N-methyltransferase 6
MYWFLFFELGRIVEKYLKAYGDVELQRIMVSDSPRTNAFHAAINEAVQPGDVVLDVGTGTGILAMFAAQAGAKKVYAIDATDVSEIATELVKANGMSDRIDVIHGRADDLQLDQEVDVIVSEWLGHAAFTEGMLPAVLDARDHNLAPNGSMLPSRVRLLIAPLDDPILYNGEGPGFWRDRIHDLDLSSLQAIELLQGRVAQLKVEQAGLLAPGQAIVDIDLLTASAEEVRFKGQLEFVPVRDGVLNGFCMWFEAELSPSVTLDTGPHCPETHWAQSYMPFSPRPVRAGEQVKVDVDFTFDPDPNAILQCVDLRLGVGEHELSYEID